MAATILVVEDEPAIQELVSYNLEMAGHRALRADNAEEALEMVRSEVPDLVVLDWMLPGLSGIELCRRLRGPHTPLCKIDGLNRGRGNRGTLSLSPHDPHGV